MATRSGREAPGTYLFAAFVAVTALFATLSVISARRLAEIEARTDAESLSALPAIDRLSDAPTRLLELQFGIGAFVRTATTPDAEDRAQIEAARTAVHAIEEQTRDWPAADRQDLAALTVDLRALDRAADGVLARLDARKWPAASRDLQSMRTQTQRVDDDVRRLIHARIQRVLRDFGAAAGVARRAGLRAVGVGAFNLALAAALAGLAYATVRGYARRMVERQQELEIFGGRVAHDLMSPLSAAMLGVERAKRKLGSDHPAVDMLVRCHGSLQRMQSMVEDLFAFARAGATPTRGESCDVRGVLEGLVAETSARALAADVRLELTAFPDCRVAVPSGVLASVASNLINNALKYIGDAKDRAKTVTVQVSPLRSVVRFEIADTGPGIPKALLGSIFEAYVRAPGVRQDGIGLGLATVKRLTESHGGALGVVSEVGVGSRFWFELPMAAAPAEGAAGGERSG